MEQTLDVTAKGRTLDAAYIAEHAELFGFTWQYRDLNKGRDQKTTLRANVPHLYVADDQFDLFRESFPKVVMASINGTSAVIRGQNVARPFIRDNPRASDAAIREHIVRSVLLNVVTRGGGTRTVYVGADGIQYATAEAAANAGNKAVKQTSPLELAQAFISDATEMGVKYEVAREKALAKWPEAFVQESPVDEDDDEDAETDADERVQEAEENDNAKR